LQAGQFSSENWFDVGYTIRQQKLVCCRLHNLAAKSVSLLVPQFQ
jgi:hypothetical protein